jgi:cobalamin biosynthesis Co2+ chelatase CbiK
MNIAVILLTLHDTKSKSNLNYLSINYIMTNKSFGFRLVD